MSTPPHVANDAAPLDAPPRVANDAAPLDDISASPSGRQPPRKIGASLQNSRRQPPRKIGTSLQNNRRQPPERVEADHGPRTPQRLSHKDPAEAAAHAGALHPSHLRLSPNLWCVTRADLVFFQDEVRSLWASGFIPDDPAYPNEFHDDPKLGPSVYQVNQHYIKPCTLMAGGMSWALMRNPDGLDCDVFASHCWAEGAFEFCTKVLRMWPRDAKHLYCCFLANPQNGDIGALLGDDPRRSPFAKALSAATYCLVVPNRRVSVYSRLWCVFEAHMALELDSIILLPTKPRTRKRIKAAAPLVGLWLLATVSYGMVRHFGIPKLVVVEIDLVSSYAVPAFVVFLHLGPRLTLAPNLIVGCLAFAAGLHSTRLVTHGLPDSLKEVVEMAFDYVPKLFMELGICQYAMKITSRKALEDEGDRLAFQTVRHAHCSNASDEEVLKKAIEGREDSIDDMIWVLQDVGRYDATVVANLRRGMSRRRLRDGRIHFFALVGCTLWVHGVALSAEGLSVTVETASAYHGFAVLGYLVVSVLATALTHHFQDHAIFATDAASWSGVGAVIFVVIILEAGHLASADRDVARLAAFLACAAWLLLATARCCLFYRSEQGRTRGGLDEEEVPGKALAGAPAEAEGDGTAPGPCADDEPGSGQAHEAGYSLGEAEDMGCDEESAVCRQSSALGWHTEDAVAVSSLELEFEEDVASVWHARCVDFGLCC